MDELFDLHILHMESWKIYNYTYVGIDRLTREAFVIDPAWQINKIVNILKSNHAELKTILLTHSHFDHVNLVNQLVTIFKNPQVYMSKSEIDFYHYKCKNLLPIHDMDQITLGNLKILSLLTPGHTKGGMCYWVGGSLFTGDTIFTEGCGLCQTIGGSAEQMYDSIQKIKNIVPFNIKVFPGHSYGKKPGATIETLHKENIYFQINCKSRFVEFRTRENQKGLFNFTFA